MTNDALQRVQELFAQALDLPPGERHSFLADACRDDSTVRAEVESLLRHDEQASGRFLGDPEGGDPIRGERSAGTTECVAAEPGATHAPSIEGYEIIRELHRGGQGVVYEAFERATKRRVAIKVLVEGTCAGKPARRRFEREIELVASLKHPNIVSVFHSGTTADGQQYCVMDYVRGRPLHEFVRARKLTLEKTLQLFATVCEAVNYAHQRGVMHRDLKPANVLVESNGNPKVLDFGLAKMVGGPEQTLVSLTGHIVGTLPYMSPEQVRGNPDEIDTRTDVYSLGVILYEILTGQYPYPVVGQMGDVLHHIAETPPAPPSRRWRRDSGVTERTSRRMRAGQCPVDDEVETIVLRSLAKDRERRYQGAGELARDLGHYLAGEPIDAKRDSALYMLKTSLRRYRLPVAVTAAFIALLAIGVCVISWLYVGLNDAWEKNRRLETTIRAQQRLLGAELPSQPDELDRPADPIRVAEVASLVKLIEAGDAAGALTAASRSLDREPANALLLASRGFASLRLYESTRSDDDLNRAIADYQEVADRDPRFRPVSHEGIGTAYFLRARARNDAGDRNTAVGDHEKAADDYRRAAEGYQEAIDEYTEALELQPNFPRAYSNRGHAYFNTGDYASAASDYKAAVSAGPAALGKHVSDAWRTCLNYGAALRLLNETRAAVVPLEWAVQAQPQDGYLDIALGLVYLDVGRTEDADAAFEAAERKQGSEEWYGRVARCLRGDLSADDLVATAAEEPGEACEAYYYAAEAFARDGERERARDSFEKCVSTCEDAGRRRYYEYRWARWRLNPSGRREGAVSNR